MTENTTPTCINCERSQAEIPLLLLQFKDQGFWLCSGCLPTLLHQPQKLVGRLAGAEGIQPVKHDQHEH
jgi:hypothetical protein